MKTKITIWNVNIFKRKLRIELINMTGTNKFPEIILTKGCSLLVNDGDSKTKIPFAELEMLSRNKIKIKIYPDSIRTPVE